MSAMLANSVNENGNYDEDEDYNFSSEADRARLATTSNVWDKPNLTRGDRYVPSSNFSPLGGDGLYNQMASPKSNPNGDARPMTAVFGAGYRSGQISNSLKSFNNKKDKFDHPKDTVNLNAQEEAKIMEKSVHDLLEKAVIFTLQGDYISCLDTAKEAGKKERMFTKHIESNKLFDQQDNNVTYAVWLTLGVAYQRNSMFEEAISAYTYLLKKKVPSVASAKLRVNMGNIYFVQEKFRLAIKMYRMAIDQIPNDSKEIGHKICCNIGKSFVKLGQYREAIQNFERAIDEMPDFKSAFDLLLCCYALGDLEKMRSVFLKLISIPYACLDQKAGDDKEIACTMNKITGTKSIDSLDEKLRKEQKEADKFIRNAARLLAPVLGKDGCISGYSWLCEKLKDKHPRISYELEIEMAVEHLKGREYHKSIASFKKFEKIDRLMKTMATTNLSSIYFLEQDYKQADEYANMAVQHTRYNASALVNKGNCLFAADDLDGARSVFLEAVGVQADCVEAIYNLGLVNVRIGQHDEARQAFEKLHSIIPNDPCVIYQIAATYEEQNNLDDAIKWLNVLITRVPNDAGVLSRLGQLLCEQEEEAHGLHYQLESYHAYPFDLDVISWIGVRFVKQEMYEKSIEFFTQAARIQPNEVQWMLMISSCHKRMGEYSKAYEMYEAIHSEYPNNTECLQYLVSICSYVGKPSIVFQQRLNSLQQNVEQPKPPEEGIEQQQLSPTENITNYDDRDSMGALQTKRGIVLPMVVEPSKNVGKKGIEREEISFSDVDVKDILQL